MPNSSSERQPRRRCGRLAAAWRRGAHRRSSATISPSRIWMRRWKPRGDASSCVISTSVAPSEASPCSSAITSPPDFGVEVAGRLVGEDDQRPLGDGPRDRHALALATGQLLGPELKPVPRPDPLECGPRGLASLPERLPGVEHPEWRRCRSRSSFPGGGIPGTRSRSDVPAAPPARRPRPRPRRSRRRDVAAGGPLERAHDRQHRRLARPRRPDHCQLLALRAPRRDPAQRDDSAGVLLGRRVRADERRLIPGSRSPAARDRYRGRRSARSRQRTGRC